MPRIPTVSTLNANSVGILNTIRDNASLSYQQAVPTAKETTESIRMVGEQILGVEARRNEFIDAIVNRIALVLIESKMWDNPLRVFKRGYLELGESIEEIFIRLADPEQFNPEVAETELFKRKIPDVKSMFHAMNYQKFYKVTVSNDQLRQAFLSWDGVTDMISRIVQSMFTAMNFDEYIMIKYMIAVLLRNATILTEKIPAYVDSDGTNNSDKILTTIKKYSNDFLFLSDTYNIAGVENATPIENQYLLQSTEFSANIDVNGLAKAFNLEYAEFLGHQIKVNTFAFTNIEKKRLEKLLKDDPTFDPTIFTDQTLQQTLPKVGAILLDKDFFMMFDNLQESTWNYNGQGLYYNYFLHVWKTFSASPFCNIVAFGSGPSGNASGVTVYYNDETYTNGQRIVTSGIAEASPEEPFDMTFNTSVNGVGFYNKGVTITADENIMQVANWVTPRTLRFTGVPADGDPAGTYGKLRFHAVDGSSYVDAIITLAPTAG